MNETTKSGKSIAEQLREFWSFNEYQEPTNTMYDREVFINTVLEPFITKHNRQQKILDQIQEQTEQLNNLFQGKKSILKNKHKKKKKTQKPKKKLRTIIHCYTINKNHKPYLAEFVPGRKNNQLTVNKELYSFTCDIIANISKVEDEKIQFSLKELDSILDDFVKEHSNNQEFGNYRVKSRLILRFLESNKLVQNVGRGFQESTIKEVHNPQEFKRNTEKAFDSLFQRSKVNYVEVMTKK